MLQINNHLRSKYFLWVLTLMLLIVAIGVKVSADSPTSTPTPQPVDMDSTGNVTSENAPQQIYSADVIKLSNISILCFTTRTYSDPCLRVESLFTNVTIIRSESSFPTDLSGYDVIYIGYGEGNLLDSHASQFETYVNSGGGLIASQPNLEGTIDVYPPGFEMTVTDIAWPGFPNHPGPVEFTGAGASHPILNGLTPEDPSGNFDTIPINTLGPGWTLLVKSVDYPHVALAVGNYGAGRLAFHSGNIGSGSVDEGSDAYIQQMIEWAGAESTPGPDMKIDAIEVTQAIQDLNNSVDLIANKRTYVRVHVSSPTTIANVTANLSGERGGTTLYPTLIPRNPGSDITIKTSPERDQLDDSFWFELPSSWLNAGNLTLTARLDPANAKNDPNLSNNTISVTVNLQDTPPLRLKIFNVPYKVNDTTYQAANFHFDMLESWLRRAYPISELEVTRRIFTYVESGVPNANLLNARLATARLFDIIFSDEDSRTVYYGMVDDGGGFMRGKAGGIPGTTAAGPTGTSTFGWDNDGSYGDWYGAHEIAHTRNRYHAEFCGAGDGVPYPYPNGRISPDLTGNTALYGFDIEDQTIYDPDWHDVMTYCTNQWVSDFTYEGIRDYLVTVGQAQVQSLLITAAADEFVVITGMADLETNTGEIESIYLIHETGDVPLPEPGDWVIALQDVSGTDLITYAFTPLELTDAEEETGRPAIIAVAVPTVADLAQVEIRYQGSVIDERAMSANPPTVTITSPQPGQQLGNGSFTFTWTASDLDGDPLSFSVLYSHDNGTTWQTIATGLETQALELDVDLLSGGSGSFLRVVASDGFLSGEDVSGPFSVPTHAPEVEIISPEANASFWPVQLVVFQGNAYDREDGQLTGASLEWSSSLDGPLGTGEMFSTVDLSTGQHIIILRVTDSDNMVTEVQQTITVLAGSKGSYGIFLPIIIK